MWISVIFTSALAALLVFIRQFFRRSPPEIVLPNELRIKQLNTWETKYLFQEIWVERSYFKHGVSLQEGAVVFDIGANIGLFSMHVCSEQSNLRIFAFEPIPTTYAVMKDNVQKWCKNTASENLVLLNVGVGKAPEVEVEFVCDPFVSVAASTPALARSTGAAWKAIDLRWARAFMLHQHRLAPSQITRAAISLISLPVIGTIVSILVFVYQTLIVTASAIRKALFQAKYTCKLVNLERVMTEHKVERIDLLKVDVEGAELDVLNGIKDSDWPKIQQVVMEVHNINGTRTAEITRLLQSRGFTVKEECEEELFALMGMSTLFCTRGSVSPLPHREIIE